MSVQRENALPIGTILLGKFELGKALAQSRQALCYIAWDRELRQPVLAEEFFPKGTCIRQNEEVKANGPGISLFGTAVKKMYESPRPGNRTLPCIQAFMHEGTCFRVYTIESGKTASERAEELLDHPILFRDGKGKPLMTVNALPIPEIPPVRAFRELKEEELKTPKTSKKKSFQIWIFLIILICIVGVSIALYLLLVKTRPFDFLEKGIDVWHGK